jgi:membrane fusion protein (multidrug efflux system)
MQEPNTTTVASNDAATSNNPKTVEQSGRRRMLVTFGAGVAAIALAWSGYELLVGSRQVSTDNAYVAAYSATITPQTSGAVAEVLVRDAQPVSRNDVLVVLDDVDARLTLATAEADLERARNKTRQYRANANTATARVGYSDADIARNEALVASARSGLERARAEFERRQTVERSGAVSGEEVSTTREIYEAAKASLRAASAALDQVKSGKVAALSERTSALALAGASDIDRNPEVLVAQAAVDTARLNLERSVIRAPMNGIVARRRVQVGQHVAIGAELMTVVPVSQVYIEANFKETQLRKIRNGQPVTLTADRYGSNVKYHGRVDGLSGGTGSAFAVIPAQNATGNWIKVVQRLPVHITLDPSELARHPLRVGLSMEATVDVSGSSQQQATEAL